MDKIDITVDYVAPIPAGNMVEIVQFRDAKGKPLTGIWIKDLMTDVEYGMDFHYENRNIVQWDMPTVWPAEVRSDLEVDKKLRGIVRKCRVMTMRSSKNWMMQTRLSIEKE
ncbi:MAG: hypothetical protein ABIJ16_07935 [Bacteroidota bacterium]